MPPKKAKQVEPSNNAKKEAQTKLFSKEKVEEPEPSVSNISKGRSKKFSTSDPSSLQDIKTSIKRWNYGTGKTPDRVVISSWNVNGIRSVISKGELSNYVQKLDPDIICINETKIDEAAFDKGFIQILGYNGYWNFCKSSAGYSGVAIFSKHQPITVIQDLPQKQHSQQGRVLTMEFQKFFLVTAYIPNAGQKLERLDYRVKEYDICFQAHCEKLRQKKPTFICGDLNVCHKQIDIARPKGNEKTAGFTLEERKSFTQFLEKGWIDSFRTLHPEQVKYSWWSMRTGGRAKGIGWRLDYFLVNKQAWKFVKQSRINNDIYGSDHCPVELVVEF